MGIEWLSGFYRRGAPWHICEQASRASLISNVRILKKNLNIYIFIYIYKQ